jgi:DNA-binding MarR family transcriptional regulator
MKRRSMSSADWALWHSWMEAQRVVASQIDGALQARVGISKAEFSVLRALGTAADSTLRVGALAAALQWEKSRVSHLLTRMENRRLVDRREAGAPGRRTAVTLSHHGDEVLEAALNVHESSVVDLFISRLTRDQASAIRTWSDRVISTASSPIAPASL